MDMLTNEVTSTRVAGRVKQVADALKPYHKLPAVREFEERANRVSLPPPTGAH